MKFHGIDRAITVQSSNVELGESLTYHAREKIQTTASKFFGRVTEADVHFRKEGASHHCSIRFKVGALKPFKAEMTHINPYRAFNYALQKVAAQMRRVKSELRDEHNHHQRLDKLNGYQTDYDPPPQHVEPTADLMDEELPNLATAEGADDYVRATTQAAMHEREKYRQEQQARDLEETHHTSPPPDGKAVLVLPRVAKDVAGKARRKARAGAREFGKGAVRAWRAAAAAE